MPDGAGAVHTLSNTAGHRAVAQSDLQSRDTEKHTPPLHSESQTEASSPSKATKDDFWTALHNTPQASIQVFGFPNTDIISFIEKVEEKSNATNLFVRSSGIESILL